MKMQWIITTVAAAVSAVVLRVSKIAEFIAECVINSPDNKIENKSLDEGANLIITVKFIRMQKYHTRYDASTHTQREITPAFIYIFTQDVCISAWLKLMLKHLFYAANLHKWISKYLFFFSLPFWPFFLSSLCEHN